MTLKDSTLEAINMMNDWATYIEVYDFMISNNLYIGKSKTPDKSVASELYKHAEKGQILKVKEGKGLPKYKHK